MTEQADEGKTTQPVAIPSENASSFPPSSCDNTPADADECMQLIASANFYDISALLAIDGAIVFISDSVGKITGWTPQELLQRPYIELIHPEDRLRTLQSFSLSVHGEPCVGCEWRFRCPSGNYIWMESKLNAIGGPGNIPKYIVASLRDITIRKNFELELLKSEEHYRSLIENYPGGISIIRDGKFFFVNRVGINILGFENSAELLGRNFETFIVPSHRQEMIETYEKKMNNVPVHGSREIPVIRKDGTLINLYIDMAFVSTFKGPSIICYYMDTAEINSKEIVLRQRLKRLRLIIQSSRDIFFDWDIATGHLEHGSAFLDMLGYEPGEYQPSYEMWASLLHPEEKGWITKALHDHLDGKTDFYESEHRLRHKAGHYVWIEARGMVTIRDEKGRPLRMSGSYLDITRRKTLEIEIATTRSELERLVQERTTELNETNIALKVLLNKKEAEKTGFENSIVMNIRGRLHPHINKLRNSGLERDQLAVLEMLEKDVQEIMSPFLNKIKMDYPTLTPREIQIVERIRNGKKSNDIANEFHISVRTVDLFRHKIRKKLNINGRKVKLESIISCI